MAFEKDMSNATRSAPLAIQSNVRHVCSEQPVVVVAVLLALNRTKPPACDIVIVVALNCQTPVSWLVQVKL